MDLTLVALALAAAGCFALALVLTQFGLRTLPPLTGACVSVPATMLMFLGMAPLTIDLADWRTTSAATFAIAGAVFPAAVTLLTFTANRAIGPSLTGALGNLTPLFAVAIAVLWLGELPRAGQLAAIAAICAGLFVLLGGSRPPGALPDVSLLALGLPLLAALIRGLVQPLVKLGLTTWPNPFAAVTIGYVVSALVVLGFGLLRGAVPRPGIERTGTIWFASVGLANGLAVLCLYGALARGPVTVVAPLVATYPLFTLVLNRVLRGDRTADRRTILDVVVTVAGIALLLAS